MFDRTGCYINKEVSQTSVGEEGWGRGGDSRGVDDAQARDTGVWPSACVRTCVRELRMRSDVRALSCWRTHALPVTDQLFIHCCTLCCSIWLFQYSTRLLCCVKKILYRFIIMNSESTRTWFWVFDGKIRFGVHYVQQICFTKWLRVYLHPSVASKSLNICWPNLQQTRTVRRLLSNLYTRKIILKHSENLLSF